MGAGWFSNYLGLLKRSLSIIPLKGRVQGMEPTHSHGPLANATAPSAGGSPVPDGEDSRRGAEAEVMGGGMQLHRSSYQPLPWPAETVTLHYSPKMLGAEHGTYPLPWAGRKRHRALCGRLSGSGWGGLAQRRRGAEAQRIWEGGGLLHRSSYQPLPWPAETVTLHYPPKRRGSGHGTDPSPWSGCKRHRALCGRLSGSGWEKVYGMGFGREKPGTATLLLRF